jgi:hypothetical protein
MVNSFVNNVSVDGSKIQNNYAIDLRLTWVKKEENPSYVQTLELECWFTNHFF